MFPWVSARLPDGRSEAVCTEHWQIPAGGAQSIPLGRATAHSVPHLLQSPHSPRSCKHRDKSINTLPQRFSQHTRMAPPLLTSLTTYQHRQMIKPRESNSTSEVAKSFWFSPPLENDDYIYSYYLQPWLEHHIRLGVALPPTEALTVMALRL